MLQRQAPRLEHTDSSCTGHTTQDQGDFHADTHRPTSRRQRSSEGGQKKAVTLPSSRRVRAREDSSAYESFKMPHSKHGPQMGSYTGLWWANQPAPQGLGPPPPRGHSPRHPHTAQEEQGGRGHPGESPGHRVCRGLQGEQSAERFSQAPSSLKTQDRGQVHTFNQSRSGNGSVFLVGKGCRAQLALVHPDGSESLSSTEPICPAKYHPPLTLRVHLCVPM